MASLSDHYSKRMTNHPYGHALYHPVSTRDLRPGSVGFFNAMGVWNPIAHLEDSESLTRHGLRFPTQSLTAARPERISKWTPKVSEHVSQKIGGVDLDLSGNATGLPVEAKLQIEYETSTDSGAVLITSSPVTHEGFHYNAPFEDWVKNNAKALLHGPLASDIKEHGLFVVTHSYAAEKVALTAWRKTQNKAYFGFGIGAMGFAKIDPHVGWYAGTSETGWNVHEAGPGELNVVFAAGVAYRMVWPLTSQLHRTPSPNRRSASPQPREVISVVGMDGNELCLESTVVGQRFGSSAADVEDADNREADEEGSDVDLGAKTNP